MSEPEQLDFLAPKVEAALRRSAQEMASIFIENQPIGEDTLDKCVTAGMKKLGETT